MKTKRRDTSIALISFAVIMLVWWLGTKFTNVNKVFLPSPRSVWDALLKMARDGSLWENTWRSTYRVLIGWLLSVAAALPSLMDDMRLTIGWAWTYLVVAEMVAADAGLGYMILKNQRYLATDVIFSGLIMIGLVGLVTDWIFRIATKLIVPWQERLHAK